MSARTLYNVKEYQNKTHAYGEYSEGTTMDYDGNGNMTRDYGRDILSIKYNILNLPDVIRFCDGSQILNLYDASGRKLCRWFFHLQVLLAEPLTGGDPNTSYFFDTYPYYDVNAVYENQTDYIDNLELDSQGSMAVDGSLIKRLYHDEGYATYVLDPIEPRYHYFRRDHLGDNREVWRASYKYGTGGAYTSPAATVQRTQYYPSGLPMASNSGDNPGEQWRKYNGKEFVEMYGYDAYDFGHRDFYAAANIFTTIDWKAEDTPDISPYSYACNNPVRYRDENGDGAKDFVKGIMNAFVDDANPLSNLRGVL